MRFLTLRSTGRCARKPRSAGDLHVSRRHMTPPSEDLDRLIMTNAYEESRLAELLADYHKDYPEVTESGGRQLLINRLSELVSIGKVGLYEAEIGRAYDSGKDYRDLSPHEALAVISSPDSWDWSWNDNAKMMHYLFAKE